MTLTLRTTPHYHPHPLPPRFENPIRFESEQYMPRQAYSTLRSAPSHANSRPCVRAPTASRVRTFRTRRQALSVAGETLGSVDMVEHFAHHGEGCTQPIVGTLDTHHIKHKPQPEKTERSVILACSEKGMVSSQEDQRVACRVGPSALHATNPDVLTRNQNRQMCINAH